MKRITALLLAIFMAFSLMTAPALADAEAALPEEIAIVETEPETAAESEPEEVPEVEELPEAAPVEEAIVEEETVVEETPAAEAAPVAQAAFAEEMDIPEEPKVVEAAPQAQPKQSTTIQLEEKSGIITNASYSINTETRTITLSCKSGQDIRNKLNSALSAATKRGTAKDPYTVKIPKGNYKISRVINIFSNTTLDMGGSTLTYTCKTGNMLSNGSAGTRKGKGKGGYKGYVNITIKNGIMKSNSKCKNCMVRLAHGTNFTIQNVTFDKCWGAHEMEVAGINGFTVKNCTFKNLTPPKSAKTSYEALELDILANDRAFGDFINDATVMKNVLITGTKFSNSARGVGCHNQLIGSYHKNITISNCSFSNMKDAAIFGNAWTSSTIENNTMTNCGQGIYFSSVRAYGSSTYTKLNGKKTYKGSIVRDFKTVIRNNKISVKVVSSKWCKAPVGIYLYGHLYKSKYKGNSEAVPAGDYSLKNVVVTGNTITSTGCGIRLDRTKSSTIMNNTITHTGKSNSAGIYLTAASTDNIVDKNQISKFKRTINVAKGCSTKKSPTATLSAGKLKLEYYDITLAQVGHSYTCKPGNGTGPYTYKSANTSVCKVSSNGTITAVGSGQTTVSASSADGYTASIIVRVP